MENGVNWKIQGQVQFSNAVYKETNSLTQKCIGIVMWTKCVVEFYSLVKSLAYGTTF